MRQCHECEGSIQDTMGVQRVLKTGSFMGIAAVAGALAFL